MGTISRSRVRKDDFENIAVVTGTERMNVEMEQVHNKDLRIILASALRKANSFSEAKSSSRRRSDPGLQHVLSNACKVAFYAKHICNTYNIEGKERDVILTTCLLLDIVRELGGIESISFELKDSLRNQPEVQQLLAALQRLSVSGRSQTRKLKELFEGGDRIEIVVGLSLLSSKSGIC